MDNTAYDLTPDNTQAYDISEPSQPISEGLASKRAAMAQYALAPMVNADYDQLKYNFQSGQEQSVRQQAASQIDQQKQQDLQNTISNTLSTIVDPKLQLKAVKDLVGKTKPTNPDSVIEDTLAQK